ncbi:MAG: aminoglycoside phosphotransferase family protein [Bacillota bacterium]
MASSDLNLDVVLSQLGYGVDGRIHIIEPIVSGQSGGRVFRLHTSSRNTNTLILKLLEPDRIPDYLRQDYPHIVEAEWRFYTELGPRLATPLPNIYEAGRLPNGCSFLLMEDLAKEHLIPSSDHSWTNDELLAVLSTYAMLHGRSARLFANQSVPNWLHGDDRERFSPVTVLACLQSFYDNAWTQASVEPIVRSPALGVLLERVTTGLTAIEPAVLFNDFYPPNVALPLDGGPAKLFDWQLVGNGPRHLDIVNIGFLSRQDGFARVDRAMLLDFYLKRYTDESGEHIDAGLFMHEYSLAKLLAWGVFMPRMVRIMQKASQRGERFSPWMERTFDNCTADWMEELRLI